MTKFLRHLEHAMYMRNLHLINDVENEGLKTLVLGVNYLSLPKELELMIVL